MDVIRAGSGIIGLEKGVFQFINGKRGVILF
jgi:hypothetical protein